MTSSLTSFVDDGERASWLRDRAERRRSITSAALAVVAHVAAIGIPFWLHDIEPLLASRASTRTELDMAYPTASDRDASAVEQLVSIVTSAGGAEQAQMAKDGRTESVAKPLASTHGLSTERRSQRGKVVGTERGAGAGSGKGASSGDIFGGINVPVRHYSQGFPGGGSRNEFLGVRYTGSFAVKRSGLHQFRLLSDDGSQLFIDGRLIIDNDGLHGVQDVTNSIELEVGQHDIIVNYFQGPREQFALQLFVAAPHLPERTFTTHVW